MSLGQLLAVLFTSVATGLLAAIIFSLTYPDMTISPSGIGTIWSVFTFCLLSWVVGRTNRRRGR